MKSLDKNHEYDARYFDMFEGDWQRYLGFFMEIENDDYE